MRSGSAIRPRRCRPSTSARCSASAWFWTEDEDFDIEAHVRALALPRPGRIHQLLRWRRNCTATTWIASVWEYYIIDGVDVTVNSVFAAPMTSSVALLG